MLKPGMYRSIVDVLQAFAFGMGIPLTCGVIFWIMLMAFAS